MIRRSLSWTPFSAYTGFAFAFACAVALGVVAVYLARDGVMGIYALYLAPLYLIAFSVVAEAVVIVWVLMRPRLQHLEWRLRAALVAALAALGGAPIGYACWWVFEFRAPPVWFGALAALVSATAFWWYAARYEFEHSHEREAQP
ncbi:hypothetical protein [Agromyces aerolatus]|uniref:hypothetical protein n=1 Tax=Agromyces sp. LY-1074 TaxID=3074080 RepID=UPI0028603CE0|nr:MULTISPECIES: hypothetical protein [unclassified Agromyces]MDR5701871.1 hypothetical protein [Agromyces sp. LY-1074]MDR5708115.1 hypothetical protein [Agromyces sp. LY-1358]